MELPLTALDKSVEFVDWTILIYLTQFGIICSPFVFHDDFLSMNETLYGMLIATGIAFVVFMVFPTTLPRDALVPSDWLAGIYAQLYGLDQPVNCFPSLHVALAHLTWTTYLRGRSPKAFGIGLWALLITVSTITTKQHYVIDVVGGVALAGLSWTLARRLVRQQMARLEPGHSTD